MHLLDDNLSGIMASWVQAGCAIGTIILGIIMFVQKKRIEELTDIVLELRNQTKELQAQTQVMTKRYDLENLLSLKERIPFFERSQFYLARGGMFIFELLNVGTDAVNLTFSTVAVLPPLHKSNYLDFANVKHGETFKVELFGKGYLEQEEINFSFTLCYLDGGGNRYSQKVICTKGIPAMDIPQTL